MSQTLSGQYAELAAFTGTLANGTAEGDDCQGFTSGAQSDQTAGGGAGTFNDTWTYDGLYDCDGTARIFCFSQALIDFWDNFENGALGRWSGKTS